MKLLRVFCGALALVLSAQPVLAKRVALVIGNSNYGGELTLRNPANDARAVAQSLRSLQFTVIERLDQNLAGMEEALVTFNSTLEKGDVAWFFYAGHGLQDQNVNYLVPIGADVKAAFELKRKTMDLNTIKDAMMDSGARLNVVVLDCCRDNPLTRSWKNRTRSISRGLAGIQDVPDGMIVAFSTAANTTALDGEGANSPYTANLVNVLNSRPEGGLEVKQIFFNVAQEVKKSIDQRPYLELDATMGSYFLDRDMAADAPLTAAGEAAAGLANTVVAQSGVTMPLAPAPVTMAMPPQSQFSGIPGSTMPPTQVVYVTPPGVVNTVSEVFTNGPYAAYNDWSKKSILKKVQEKLKVVGLYQGGIDGGMGPGTQGGINAWQQNNGLAVTGVLDQATLQHMMLLGLVETAAPATTGRKYSSGSSKPSGNYGGSSGEKKSGSWLDSTGGRILRGRFGF